MTAAAGAAFAAAVGMIDRVHRDAAHRWPPAEPAIAAGLADRNVRMVGIGDRPDRRHAAARDQPLLARIEPEDRIALIAACDLGIGTGGARHLAALADLQLNVVHNRADRNGPERHGVAWFHVHLLAGDDR